jgi:cytochrome c
MTRPMLLLPLVALGAAAGCGGTAAIVVPGGRPDVGHAEIQAYGCGGCHRISGVRGADGRIGPSLRELAGRWTIAGQLPNTPGNLVRWIVDPQAVDPGTLMPNLGVTAPQARDIAAYLYRH